MLLTAEEVLFYEATGHLHNIEFYLGLLQLHVAGMTKEAECSDKPDAAFRHTHWAQAEAELDKAAELIREVLELEMETICRELEATAGETNDD
jgi:hypothetical protein